MALLYRLQKNKNIHEFVLNEMMDAVTGHSKFLLQEPRDIVLYGFGRIGRLLARLLIEKTGGGEKMLLKAIVVRKGKAPDDLSKRANLLRRDSVHGAFHGTISIDHQTNGMLINGNFVQLIYSEKPSDVDYTKFGIKNAIVIDNTGIWRDKNGLSQHLKCPGVSKVVLTAPTKDTPNVVSGINDHLIKDDVHIYGAASCTTNATVPVLKAINEKFGIETGHVETCHAFTNDQNLIDNYHAKERRGRSAVLNMVITETGASEAIAQTLPELKGKFTGNAVRVPTPDVSLAMLMLNLKTSVTVEEVNNYLRLCSMEEYQHRIDYSESSELVSTDVVGNRAAGVVDAKATIAMDKRIHLYIWYDNEMGYAAQVIRLVQSIAGIKHPKFPKVEKK